MSVFVLVSGGSVHTVRKVRGPTAGPGHLNIGGGQKKGESSPGSEGSTHLLVHAKTSDAKPVCQTPAAVVALTPCSHGARTGISQHKLPGGAAYD